MAMQQWWAMGCPCTLGSSVAVQQPGLRLHGAQQELHTGWERTREGPDTVWGLSHWGCGRRGTSGGRSPVPDPEALCATALYW